MNEPGGSQKSQTCNTKAINRVLTHALVAAASVSGTIMISEQTAPRLGVIADFAEVLNAPGEFRYLTVDDEIVGRTKEHNGLIVLIYERGQLQVVPPATHKIDVRRAGEGPSAMDTWLCRNPTFADPTAPGLDLRMYAWADSLTLSQYMHITTHASCEEVNGASGATREFDKERP